MWQAWYEYRIDYALFTLVFLAGYALIVRRVQRSMPVARNEREASDISEAPAFRSRMAFVVLLLALAVGLACVEIADRFQRSRLRDQVIGIAPTYAIELQLLGHSEMTLETKPDDPRYLNMLETQRRWLSVNPQVADIYTMRRSQSRVLTEAEQRAGLGAYALIVDSATDYDGNGIIEGERERRTPIGEVFLDGNASEIELAFQGNVVFAPRPHRDRWGDWVCAYAPLLDSDGKVEALVGVDFPAIEYVGSIVTTRIGVMGVLAAMITLFLGSVAIIGMLKSGMALQRRHQTLLTEQRDLATRAAAEARQAAKAKSEFLANMSHEIRTPMHGVLGTTELMNSSSLNEKQRQYIGMIQTSAKGLLTVLNDILDFSKIESGRMTLEFVPFRLDDLIEQSLLAVQSGQKESVDLIVKRGDDIPNALVGDPTRLRQVLINLLSNALKFTEHGNVTLTVEPGDPQTTLDDGDGSSTLSLRWIVRDTGIGMTEEQRAKVFEAFTQADSSVTRRYGGTGLGLSICVRLVDLMGGRLHVSSQLDQGSRFEFEIPVRLADETERSALPDVSPQSNLNGRSFGHCEHPKNILLVEDGAINRTVAETMLRARGHQVESSTNAKDAIERLGRETFNIVLMDVQMPDMDGLTATQIIRDQLTSPINQIPIVAMTAHAMAEDRQRCLDAGMNAYLIKPYLPADLFHLVETLGDLQPATDSDESSSHAIFDPEIILQNVGGDISLLKVLIDTLHKELPTQVSDLQNAIKANDAIDICNTAHTLKGTASAMGAMRAQSIAGQMERDASHAANVDSHPLDWPTRFTALVNAFEMAQTELQALLQQSTRGIES